MPVTMMTTEANAGKPNVRRVDDYSGHETGRVSHRSPCPHADRAGVEFGGPLRAECVEAGCWFFGPLYLETTHVGLVLSTGERNGYDDSDFTATVWNPETGEPSTFVYASTRGWTYPNSAIEDATPEVIAAHAAWAEARRAERIRAAAEFDAKLPKQGRTVRVVKGRKVEAGATGRVFWTGPDRFSRRSRYAPSFGHAGDDYARIGVEFEDGRRLFIAGANVEVVDTAGA